MSYFSYIHDKDDLTKPVFIAEHKTKNEGTAYEQAIKNPAVKKIFGLQQTGRLIVKVHTSKVDFSKYA